jgi:hypothetical protein
MIETAERANELKTVSVEKDTWILELPAELCQREGYEEGTMASLTFKDGAIQASFIRPPSKKLRDISQKLLKKNRKLYEELKRIGDD